MDGWGYCADCDLEKPLHRGRCFACGRYRERHGRRRPAHLIEAEKRRRYDASG